MAAGPWLPILRRRGIPVFFYSLINQGYDDAYYRELLGMSRGLGRHRYVDGWVIVHSEDAEAFTAQFLPRLRDHAYVEFFLGQCEKVAEELLAFGREARGKNYIQVLPGELLLDFSHFCSLSIRVMPFLNTMVFVQDDIEGRLREALSARLQLAEDSPDLSAQMQTLMSNGGRESLAARSLGELESTARMIIDMAPEVAARIESEGATVSRDQLEAVLPDAVEFADRFLVDYDFFGTDYYLGQPSTFSDVIAQLGVFIGKAKQTALIEFAGAAEQTLLSEDRALIETAQALQYLREYRLEALFKSGRDCRKLFVRIAESLGLGYGELMCMTFGEIDESLAIQSLTVELTEIEQRMASYGCDDTAVVVGSKLNALIAELPEAEVSDDGISGVTAFAGECRGKLRVVDHLAKIDEFEAGDVLAAPMTMPYHVPAMARAGAILTDEGGILSHAAIVARELRVPCVVGLGTATTSFPSGTLVDVQALSSTGLVTQAPDNAPSSTGGPGP